MVPKQAVQVQEDHEARLERARRRAPPHHEPHVTLLPWAVGRVHGEQRGAHSLQQLHEQFWALVPNPPPGHNSQTSDDVMRLSELAKLHMKNSIFSFHHI